jgi:N-acetylglucosaminyldiphosphoundecaprenol N-acetyl-beta-D-mannosaminyltransferase
MERLLAEAEQRGWPVFLLGATAETSDRFVEVVRKRYPGVPVVGRRDGYFADDAAVAEEIRASGAALLLVAIPSPRKEMFLAENLERMGSVLAVGVGGSFDVWTGKTRRAPTWMQRWGLEWLYRFGEEPGRMWRRYLIGNARFLALVGRERLRRTGARSGT